MPLTSVISFGFVVEGDFSNGEFTEHLTNTLNTFERDIKRKANKGAISRGIYNYTATQLGDNERYMHVERVHCELTDPCVSKTQKDCVTVRCDSTIHRDHGTMQGEVEYLFLYAATLFFQYGFYDKFDHFSYLGPWVENTTLPMKMIGVPPYEMSDNEKESFVVSLSDLLQYSQIHSSMEISDIDVARQKIELNMNSNIQGATLGAVQAVKSMPRNLYESEVISNIYTLHGSPVARSFSKDLVDYFEADTKGLLERIQMNENRPEYFNSLIDIRGINDEPLEAQMRTENINLIESAARGEMNLVYGIIIIFFSIMGLTSFYILFKKKTSKKIEMTSYNHIVLPDPSETI